MGKTRFSGSNYSGGRRKQKRCGVEETTTLTFKWPNSPGSSINGSDGDGFNNASGGSGTHGFSDVFNNDPYANNSHCDNHSDYGPIRSLRLEPSRRAPEFGHSIGNFSMGAKQYRKAGRNG
jgi:hypothetical protein